MGCCIHTATHFRSICTDAARNRAQGLGFGFSAPTPSPRSRLRTQCPRPPPLRARCTTITLHHPSSPFATADPESSHGFGFSALNPLPPLAFANAMSVAVTTLGATHHYHPAPLTNPV